MPTKIEKDDITGKQTTGHEWDGLRELDTPLPRWWLTVWIACIVFAAVYALLYPSIPLGTTYFHGLLGWSSQEEVAAEIKQMDARHAVDMQRIGGMAVTAVDQNPELRAVALRAGHIAFEENCQPCHGQNGVGRVGYPPLDTDFWMWGGTLPDIERIIRYGIRSGDPNAHNSAMPPFGTSGILKPEQIQTVADYVATLFGIAKPKPDFTAGHQIFAANCAPCHGDHGQGNIQVGAPPLASHVHLYGDTREDIVRQVTSPHMGVMPAWHQRLDPATIKSLAIYVHALGGGQ